MNRKTSRWPEPARVKSDGCCVARCPACAEHGQDAKGEHLWWNPATGAFACIAHPGDQDHRKQLSALAGTPPRRKGVVTMPPFQPVRLGKPIWAQFKKGV